MELFVITDFIQFYQKQTDNLFNTEPYEKFAEKIFYKISDKSEREKFYNIIKKKQEIQVLKSPELKIKMKDYTEKWVEPKIQTPTPKKPNSIIFPNLESYVIKYFN